jgi:hypothetical protein
MSIEMDFQTAVQYVKAEQAYAYAFVPITRNRREVGGTIYLVCYYEPTGDPDDDWEYSLEYSSGLYRDSSGEEGIYGPDDIPEEAKSLQYRPAPSEAPSWMDYETQILKALLEGRPFDEVMAEN